MIKSKFSSILPEGEKPFYFAYDAEKKHVYLMDYGWNTGIFENGKWVDNPDSHLLKSWEWKDITPDELKKETGGVMPDIDPKDIDF